jgi:hypothetical protein
MPKYQVEQYEIHVSRYIVEADTEGQAISAIYNGGGELVNTEYLETAENLGMPAGNLSRADTNLLTGLNVMICLLRSG